MKNIISWNINGIRAIEKKGFFDWVKKENPDILCLQETKAQPEQLDEKFTELDGYKVHFRSAKKKGYSSVAVYLKEDPINISTLNIEEFDAEGRSIILEYPEFTLINTYFPNSQNLGKRLDYKLRFCNAILEKCNDLVKEGKNVILCGDYNIAHKPIDLEYPDANVKNAGYLPEERAWLDEFESNNYIDTFRQFNKEPKQYTWWSYRTRARDRNIGWRLDYFWVNEGFLNKVKNTEILSDILGSDHCPVKLTI